MEIYFKQTALQYASFHRMALKAKNGLKKRDEKKGISSTLFGYYFIAINKIKSVSKLKCRDGSGDPRSVLFYEDDRYSLQSPTKICWK